jgi:hypothetical protein
MDRKMDRKVDRKVDRKTIFTVTATTRFLPKVRARLPRTRSRDDAETSLRARTKHNRA